jgi:hypothetical protein
MNPVAQKRDDLRSALNEYERALRIRLAHVPRGSGHADNEFDNLKASIVQVGSARRVLWMES